MLSPLIWASVLSCSLALAAGVALLFDVLLAKDRHASAADSALGRYLGWLDGELSFLRVRLGSSLLVGCQLLVAGLLLVLAPVFPLALLPCFVVVVMPGALIRRARRERVQRLEGQIGGWLEALARCLQAAPSIPEAIFASTQAMSVPLRDELEQFENESRLGMPVDHALRALELRVKSPTISMALSTLQVGRETGGRLPQVLEEAAASLREMERLEGVVRSQTAQGRSQALVISVLPVPLYGGMRWLDPTYFLTLEQTSTGRGVLAVAVVLWVVAGWLAHKILAVEL